MDLGRLPRRVVGVVAVIAVLGGWTWYTAASAEPAVTVTDQRIEVRDGPGDGERVSLDTSLYLPAGSERAPAVLLAHGFGGSKDDLRGEAERLAGAGYVVLAYSARGFGRSTGRIALNSPDYEVKDASRLLDWLARHPRVRLDRPGDPRVGVAGASYGGALALLLAGTTRGSTRSRRSSPGTTWRTRSSRTPPGTARSRGCSRNCGPGRSSPPWRAARPAGPVDPTSPGSPRAAPCAAGSSRRSARRTRRWRSPVGPRARRSSCCAAPARPAWPAGSRRRPCSSRVSRTRCSAWTRPTATPRPSPGLARPSGWCGSTAATTVAAWRPAGYASWSRPGSTVGCAAAPRPGNRPAGRSARPPAPPRATPPPRACGSGRHTRTPGSTARSGAASGWPGRRSGSPGPPGGALSAISALPGLGDLAQGLGRALDLPGQYAQFVSAPLPEPLDVYGAPRVRLRVAGTGGDAVLFAKLYDVGPAGEAELPHLLVAPLRTGDGEVEVRLPAIAHRFEAGHRLRLVVATTDQAYATPPEPAVYQVALAGDLTLPVAARIRQADSGLPSWVWAAPLGAFTLAVLILLVRRRPAGGRAPDPDLADVPLQITGLTKRYGDHLAVADLAFRVERGQVLGLLGPNGAGKTTTLRMLMGLIHPDAGEIRVFGHRVAPGAPVLSRVGSFVEGPGLLPHLSGRQNLLLYWRATGRPAEDAHLEEVLEIAGLGAAVDKPVRTYSQGMRQRLAIAQAMLGRPDLLVLDEPTNGLDPPQIHQMREVLRRYARDGRAVIVSSHLLAEVEQTCSHVVVMQDGRAIAAGRVDEITGTGSGLVIHTPDADLAYRELDSLPGIAAVERVDGGVLVHLDGMTVSDVVVELVECGVRIERVAPNRRLEEAFLALIGEGS